MSGTRPALFLSSLLFLLGLMWAGPVAAADELIEQARELFLDEQFAQAHALLAEAEQEHAGDPEYDYWLGMTAVRSGNAARGLFALERVVTTRPGHAAARIELVGAYIQLGQYRNAADELDELEKLSPPPAAQRAIDRYRRQLAGREADEPARPWMAWVTLELGHDDNPGTWPEQLELLPGLELDVDIPETLYGALQAGGGGQHELDGGRYLSGTLSAYTRRNGEEEAEQFDLDLVQAEGEFGQRLAGERQISGIVETGRLWLDGETYRDHLGVAGQWRHRLDRRRSYRARLEVRQQDFELEQYDHTLLGLSGTLRQRFAARWRGELEARAEYEDADEERPGGDSRRGTLRGKLYFQPSPRHRLGADLRYTRVDYADEDPSQPADDERRDTTVVAGAQWDWSTSENWLLRTRVQHRDQDSNQSFYEFDQTQVSLALSRYF